MGEIKIIQVKTKAERHEFVRFPLRLYKNCSQFVPPLYGDEMKIFTDKNAYVDTCDTVCFLAKREDHRRSYDCPNQRVGCS